VDLPVTCGVSVIANLSQRLLWHARGLYVLAPNTLPARANGPGISPSSDSALTIRYATAPCRPPDTL